MGNGKRRGSRSHVVKVELKLGLPEEVGGQRAADTDVWHERHREHGDEDVGR